MLPCYLTLWAICVGYVSSQTRNITLDECTNQKEIRGHSFHMLFNGVIKKSISCTFLFPGDGGVLILSNKIKTVNQVDGYCPLFKMQFFNGSMLIRKSFTTCGGTMRSSNALLENVNKINIDYDITGLSMVNNIDVDVTMTDVSKMLGAGYKSICGYFIHESVLCDGVANCPRSEDENCSMKISPILISIAVILVVLLVIGSVVGWRWYHCKKAPSGGLENQCSQESNSLINKGGNMVRTINDQNIRTASNVHDNVANNAVSIQT